MDIQVAQDYYTNDCPFFDYYNVYHDGSHFIARKKWRGRVCRREIKQTNEMGELFESLFAIARETFDTDGKNGKDFKEIKDFIKTNMEDSFPNEPDLEKYVSDNVDRKMRNIWKREKRFRRKAYLNPWNYYVTFTRKRAFGRSCASAFPTCIHGAGGGLWAFPSVATKREDCTFIFSCTCLTGKWSDGSMNGGSIAGGKAERKRFKQTIFLKESSEKRTLRS